MTVLKPGEEYCPECGGTGFVFVMTEREGEIPLKRRPDQFDLAGRQRCGVCGGDGIIDELDLGGFDRHPPKDWYRDEKRRLAERLKDVST